MRFCWAAAIASLAVAACDQRSADDPASVASDAAMSERTAAPGAETGAPSPAPTTSGAPIADEAEDTVCGADKLGAYLNTLPTTDILAKVRAAVGHDRVRTIAPGEAVDADLRPDRLNIEAGVDGRIKRFRCG